MESILIATDGSQAAAAAEQAGVLLGARLRARVQGITVIEDRQVRPRPNDGLGMPAPTVDEGYFKARGEAICTRLAALGRKNGIEVGADSINGFADDRIVERGQNIDLTVLGRDGEHQPYRTALYGSTLDGVLRKTSKPTLIVPAGAEIQGPIVLAFDGSPGSKMAAKIATDFAIRLGQTLHVFVDSKDKGRAIARFDEVRRLLGSLSVPVQEVASTLGRPDVKVVDTAREAKAGLIIMGAYGRNRITDYFLGSNASAVVRTSPIPVLLAR